MKNIDFTIIIPHYNSIDKLERLLNSIKYTKNIQIIVVDDNTKNFDKEKISKKYDVEVYINTKLNRGAGACRNIGLDKSKGKWILFADADDYFEDNAFFILEKYKEKKVDVIYFLPSSIDEISKKSSFRHVHHEYAINNYIKNKNKNKLVYFLPEPWSKMIKRKIIERNKVRFSETEVANDKFFSVKVGYYSENILAIKEKIYCVTYNSNSITSNENEERLKTRINETFKIYEFMKSKNINKNEQPLVINLIYKLSKYKFKLIFEYFMILLKNNYKIFPTKTQIKFYIFKKKQLKINS